MLFSANPVGKESDSQQLVEQGQIAFVQIKYPPKLMLRASLTTIIHKGNHDADGVVGDRLRLTDAEVLHAPLRARDGLSARMEKAQRVEEIGVQGAQSWHLRRLLRIKEAESIDDEWKANSVRFGRIGPADRRRRPLLDLRLRRIARAQRSFVDRVFAGLVDWRLTWLNHSLEVLSRQASAAVSGHASPPQPRPQGNFRHLTVRPSGLFREIGRPWLTFLLGQQRWSRCAGQIGGLAKVDSGFDYAANFSSVACVA
jgi:hypothetical protein